MPGPATSGAESRDLAFVDRDGNIEPLKLPPGPYQHVRLSPDGTRVAFGLDNGKEADVYVFTLRTGTSMQRLTFAGTNRYPIWTPDGRRITFQSDRDGDRGLFWQPADGSTAAERLTTAEEGASHIPESWTPSADRLFYTIVKGATATLWSHSTRDRASTRIEGLDAARPVGVAFSPDGRSFAYSIASVVYVEPFPRTGARYQVGSAGHHPIWSPDGNELFFEPGPTQLQVVPVQTQPTFAFGNPVSLRAGAFGSTNPAMPRNRDLTRDGTRFIAPVVADEGTRGTAASTREIRIVLNWFEELKRLVPPN